ncbi:MAG TPA: hypothetical protein VFM62_01070 [Arthrobacter sp.]|nr:hypothetical protein [Arthrobacter sp.]
MNRLGLWELALAPVVFGIASGLYESLSPWPLSSDGISSAGERFFGPVFGGFLGAIVLGGGHWWLSGVNGAREESVQQQRLRLIKISTVLLVLIATGAALAMAPYSLMMFLPLMIFAAIMWFGHRKRSAMSLAEHALGIFVMCVLTTVVSGVVVYMSITDSIGM